jgi:hypothetical protein
MIAKIAIVLVVRRRHPPLRFYGCLRLLKNFPQALKPHPRACSFCVIARGSRSFERALKQQAHFSDAFERNYCASTSGRLRFVCFSAAC